MKVRVTEKVCVDLIMFNGKVGMDRPAPLYQCVVIAAREEPGITRAQLGKLFSIPPAWIQSLCNPLLEAKYITETENGIRLTPKGRKATTELPILQQSGDWMAAVLCNPIDDVHVLTCFEASPWRIDHQLVRRDKLNEKLSGVSFNAGGNAKIVEHRKTPAEDKKHERTLSGGTILSVDDELCAPLGQTHAEIVTINDVSTLSLKFENKAPEQSIVLDCECRIGLYHKNLDEMAEEAIRASNRAYAKGTSSTRSSHLLRAFNDMSNNERHSAQGDVHHAVNSLVSCTVSEVPIYPADKMSYLSWVAWKVAKCIDRHISEESYHELVQKESAKVPGHDQYGSLTIDAAFKLLSKKQKMYLSASKDWAPLS